MPPRRVQRGGGARRGCRCRIFSSEAYASLACFKLDACLATHPYLTHCVFSRFHLLTSELVGLVRFFGYRYSTALVSFTVFWLNEGQRQGDSEVSVSRRKEKNSNRETARGGDVLYDETVTRA